VSVPLTFKEVTGVSATDFFQKSLVLSVTLNALIQKPKYFLIELLYLLSVIFLCWIATRFGTVGYSWYFVNESGTHFVPAVGFNPQSFSFGV